MSSGTAFGSQPRRGAWLVYVNGVLIPTTQVSVNYGVWQMPEATFSVAPSSLLARLGNEDRLEVVIFYLDGLADPDNPEFKLLFEGEILGWSYATTPMGRQMSFNCVAGISIFASLFFSFMNSVEAVVQLETARNAALVGVPGVFYPFSLFKKGLLTTGKDVTSPFEILYNCVRGMLDVNIPPNFRALPAVNFFSRWARRTNFPNRFAAMPLLEDGDDPAKGVFPLFKSVQDTIGLETLRDDLSKTVGEAGAVWDVLKEVFGVAYHEVMMLPTAPCVRVAPDTGKILGPPEAPVGGSLRLLNYAVKPQMLFGIAPTCNVIFPSLARSGNYGEQYRTQPTRLYINESFISSLLPQNDLTAAALRVAYPPEVNAMIQMSPAAAQANGTNVNASTLRNSKNMLVWPEEFFKGPVMATMQLPKWLFLLASKSGNGLGKPLADLYKLYAQYEFFRQRYAQRGGQVTLAFNPYVIPGFPCVIFDQRAQPVDVVGYLMSVTHSLSVGSTTTTIQYSFGRTFGEMFELLRDVIADQKVEYGSAPLDPVSQIRDISQTFPQAETFYNALLFGRSAQPPGKPAAFDFREVVGYADTGDADYEDEVSVVKIDLTDLQATDVQPLPEARALFNDHDAAMRYVSRPICTLAQYLSFIHGEKDLDSLLATGQVEGPQDNYAYLDPNNSSRAVYYTRIKRLTPGPGDRPPDAQTNTTTTPGVAYNGSPQSTPRAFPQTRRDWDTILEEYRDAVLNRAAPQR